MATMGLNISYIKEKEICPTYVSKINSNCEKEIILLMVSSEEKEGWDYLPGIETLCIMNF